MFQMRLNQFKTSLDRGATYLFPLMFCIFNLVYWAYYLFVILWALGPGGDYGSYGSYGGYGVILAVIIMAGGGGLGEIASNVLQFSNCNKKNSFQREQQKTWESLRLPLYFLLRSSVSGHAWILNNE